MNALLTTKGCPWDRLIDRENGFDATRLVLAVLVLFEHAYYLPSNSYQAEPLFLFSKGQTDFGSLAVNGFFVISGFLITRSCLMTNHAPRYAMKRLARIVPGFLLASCLGLFVFGPLGADDIQTYFSNINWRATLVNMFSLHQSGAGYTFLHNPTRTMYDGTLWTIRYEFDCYLLVGLLWSLKLLRREIIVGLVIVLLICYGLQSLAVINLPVVNYGVPAIFMSSPNNWPRLFSYFFIGSAFYLCRDMVPKSIWIFAISLISLLAALHWGGAHIAMLSAGVYVLFFLALSGGRSLRVAGRKIDLSYGIYLFGFPVEQLIIAWAGKPIGPEILFLVSVPITCGIAYLSWTLVEAPCLRWAHARPKPGDIASHRSSLIGSFKKNLGVGLALAHPRLLFRLLTGSPVFPGVRPLSYRSQKAEGHISAVHVDREDI
jgi:peptidoglycan/LPS O-acetylase OafA/YrhL